MRVGAHLREWAVQAHADATARLSLRLEPADGGHPDGPWQAVAQVCHRADAGLEPAKKAAGKTGRRRAVAGSGA